MLTSDFDYDLPERMIAQTPIEPRDASRLMVLDRRRDTVTHARFFQLGDYLHPGDLLVLNETRVIPARIFGKKHPSGGRVELLLLRRQDALTWETLVGGKGLKPGRMLRLEGGLEAVITTDLGGPRRMVHFSGPVESIFEKYGHTPLPPYIHTKLKDPERYQTIFARLPGSAAAPTAGLHFTPELISKLQALGVNFARITLHVGLDTFGPVVEERLDAHQIHTEWCDLSPETAETINQTHKSGGRVIAVGTTSARTLESAARQQPADGIVSPFTGNTDLFILPGFRFRVVDAMITNFHLPRSTLIVMVSAFAGRTRILNAYHIAMQTGYRFYSFGDAMLIV